MDVQLTTDWYLTLAAILFSLGAIGMMIRRNVLDNFLSDLQEKTIKTGKVPICLKALMQGDEEIISQIEEAVSRTDGETLLKILEHLLPGYRASKSAWKAVSSYSNTELDQ